MCSGGTGFIVAILIAISYVAAFTLQSSIIKIIKDSDINLYKELLGNNISRFENDSLGGTDLLLFVRFYKAFPRASELSTNMQSMCRLYKFFIVCFFALLMSGLALMIACLD